MTDEQIKALVAAVKEFTPKPFDPRDHVRIQHAIYEPPRPPWKELEWRAIEAKRKDDVARAAWEVIHLLTQTTGRKD